MLIRLYLIIYTPTVSAEGSIVRSEGAVTRVPVVLFYTLPPVPAVHPVTAAVALAARIHPWSYLGPLLQVKGHTIYPQSPHAAQKTPLTIGGPLEIKHEALQHAVFTHLLYREEEYYCRTSRGERFSARGVCVCESYQHKAHCRTPV